MKFPGLFECLWLLLELLVMAFLHVQNRGVAWALTWGGQTHLRGVEQHPTGEI